MPRVKTTPPRISRQKGQRSLDDPFYISRYIPPWANPEWLNGGVWRQVVQKQPLATVCRETLTSNTLALDWKIEAKDSEKRDEYKSEIEYYTDFFSNTGDYDWTEMIEWICGDSLDIPFGSGAEIGREDDSPDGKVLWIELLDGATLFPTLNYDYPVGQTITGYPSHGIDTVYFPKHAINRTFFSPRRDIRRKGWGMAPPEKIYLALELINRGDYYYANLLLDTPSPGILDLGDMAKDSAKEWLDSWRSLLAGIDPFKIPVLYEHERPVSWVEFTKSPTELMFDKALFRYSSIVTAGYGMSLSDLGVPTGVSGGETLAGSIREERQTRRTGFARLKKKIKYFFDRLLPPYLQFNFIDLDDELNVALGRARLATATALQQLIQMHILTPEEGRQQMIADGLITISIPEKLPPDAEFPMDNNNQQINERPGMLGKPIAPSQGGYGEVKSRINDDILNINLEQNI